MAESQFAFSPYRLSVCIREKLHGLFHQAIKASMKEFFRWFKGSQFYGVVVCLPVREAMSSDRRRLPLRLSVSRRHQTPHGHTSRRRPSSTILLCFNRPSSVA
nr:hypothetical protein Iba_scaffold61450CG0010 [Ipomoea batatas]